MKVAVAVRAAAAFGDTEGGDEGERPLPPSHHAIAGETPPALRGSGSTANVRKSLIHTTNI
jgi:hypothetical protein